MQTEKHMIFAPQDQTAIIKEEVSHGPSFTDRFISTIENLEADPAVSKDSIFQWIKLFYENNPLFLNLFENSFLLIFKSHTDLNSHIEKRPVGEVVRGYSELLRMFLSNLIDMEAQVKMTQEKQDHFKNFINFELHFFCEGLTAGKFFIKEFCFQTIISSLNVICQKLDIQIEPKTQTQLLESSFYLLASKSEENKTKGIELYRILTRMGINSSVINELSIQYLEQLQNYTLRRSLVHWGINLQKDDILDRFLNRLKDKNPLIGGEVIQKLIDEGFALTDMNFQQRMKLIVDGYGSPHSNVKQKTIKYLENELIQILNQKQEEMEQRLEQKEVRLQSLNRSLSMSMNKNKNKNILFLEEKMNLNGIQKFVRIFNYERFEIDDSSDIFTDNPFVSSLIFGVIFEFALSCIPFKQIVEEFHNFFNQIQLFTVKSQECIFVYSLLRGIYQSKNQTGNDQTKKELKQFILTSNEFSQPQIYLSCLRKFFQQKNKDNLTKKTYLLKIIELLSVHLDIYDCVGKRTIYDELIKILTEFSFFETSLKQIDNQKNTQKDKQSDNFIYLQLMKASQLMNIESEGWKPKVQLVTGQADLLFSLTEIIHKILTKQPSCERGQLKLLIRELIQSRDLKIQKETIMNMHIKTANEIKNMAEMNAETLDKRPYSHMIELSKEIEKKLKENERKITSQILKAFYILVKTLSMKQNKKAGTQTHLSEFKASNYYEPVKNYIYDVADNAKFSRQGQLETCWIPYMVFYHITCESAENFITFKNLFFYYAFGQESSLCEKDSLLKLISARILVELELKHTPQKVLSKGASNSEPSVLQKIIENLMNQNLNDPCEQYFFKQVIMKTFNALPSSQKADSLHCKMFLFTFKQFLDQSNEGVFSRMFSLVFRNMALTNLEDYFNKILLFYSVLAKLVDEQKAVLKKEDKHLIFWNGNKMLKSFFNFIRSQKCCESEKQMLSKDLLQFIVALKMMEIIPYQMLTPLTCLQTFKNVSNSSFKDFSIENLIFFKSQFQKLLEKLKQRSTQVYHSIQKEFVNLSYLLETLEQKIGEEISKRLKPQETNLYEQQSTDHSPAINLEKNQKATREKEMDKIDFDQIDLYKAELQAKFNSLNSTAHEISQSLKRTNAFKSLCKDLVIFVAKYKANLSGESSKKDEIKVEEDINDEIGILQREDSRLNPILVEFDRKGRRKLTDSEKLKNKMIIKGSVKKSRYIIIPYDLVETAQEKYGRKGSSKKRSRKIGSSGKYNNDKSYYSPLRARSSHSQQKSNQQLSSQQISSQQQSLSANGTETI